MLWFASTKGLQVLAVRQDLASQVLQNEFSVLFREPVGIELSGTRIKGRLGIHESLLEHLLVFADQQECFLGRQLRPHPYGNQIQFFP
jgi:hypothetical protein